MDVSSKYRYVSRFGKEIYELMTTPASPATFLYVSRFGRALLQLANQQPAFTVTGVAPDAGTINADPSFTVTGAGFQTVGVQSVAVVVDGYPDEQDLGPVFAVMQDTELLILSGVMAGFASLSGSIPVAPPFQGRIKVYPTGGGAAQETPLITVSPAPPPADLLDGAAFVPFNGLPEEIAVSVATGAGYQLPALQTPPTYVQSTSVPAPPSPAEDWTFALWFRRREADGGLLTFSEFDEATWDLTFSNGAMQNVSAQLSGTLVTSAPGSLTTNDYSWHLAVFVRDASLSGTVSLYLDGALAGSAVAEPFQSIDNGGTFIVGKDDIAPSPSVQGTGAVWFRSLSGSEVQDLWNASSFPP